MKFEELLKLFPVSPSEGIPGYRYLYDYAMRSPLGSFVEIGSQYGWSSVVIAAAAHERNLHLYLIDPMNRAEPAIVHDHNFDYLIQTADETELISKLKLLKIRSNWTYLKNRSDEIAPIFNLPISFMFIDGCHCYPCAKLDWNLWSPKVIPGGIIVIHDATNWVGPKQMANEIPMYEFILLETEVLAKIYQKL